MINSGGEFGEEHTLTACRGESLATLKETELISIELPIYFDVTIG